MTNRFKGLNLVERVPEELRMEVHNTVQEVMVSSQRKRNAKARWLSEEALQIAEKRTEVKGKGERERHTHLNACFQRITRRDKKAFLGEQCKETEENNRRGKTRDLFKKIGDTREHFMQRWAQLKNRNSKDLTQAEEIKKKWQEYTEELYKSS